MMVRRGKKGSFEGATPVFGLPVRADGDDSRARFRFQSLLQDYQELVQEAELRKNKLQNDKRKRLRLLAEVKFLRAKRKSLLENPKQLYRFKKPPRDTQPKPSNLGRSSGAHVPKELPAKEINHRVVEDAKPSTSGWLDLNQISLPDTEDMGEFQFQWEQQKQNEMPGLDLKLSMCRNVGSNTNDMGKRKVTWEDQVVLRV